MSLRSIFNKFFARFIPVSSTETKQNQTESGESKSTRERGISLSEKKESQANDSRSTREQEISLSEKKESQAGHDESTSDDSNVDDTEPQSDFDDVSATMHIPSRYRELWAEAQDLVEDESELSQLHPSQLSAGDWKSAIRELEKIVNRKDGVRRTGRDRHSNGTKRSLQEARDQELIDQRISEVRQNSHGTTDLDPNTTREWLNVWSRWHSLSSPPNVAPVDQPVNVLTGIGESVSADLDEAGYGTLEAISGTSEDELRQVEGIGKSRAQSILRQLVTRPVGDIPGVGDKTQYRLAEIGVETAVDLTAVSIENLTSVEGIGSNRAETYQAKAAIWLPSYVDPSDALCEPFGPPYDNIERANEQLDQFERALGTFRALRNIDTAIAGSPLTIPDQGSLEDLLFEEEVTFLYADLAKSGADSTWEDVLNKLEAVATESDRPTLNKSERERLNIGALPPVELQSQDIFHVEDPSKALERINAAEQEIAQQARFAEIAATGASAIATAEKSSVEVSEALVETLTEQCAVAYEQLVESGKLRHPELLEQYLLVAHQSVDLSESYPEYPFENIVTDLASIDSIESVGEDELATLVEIVSVSDDALSMLEATEYDHPAVDQTSWQESILEALENRYAKILNPIDEQLSRLEDGLWHSQDLSKYDWRDLEHLIGDLYRDNGYDVTVSQSGSDLGVDVWATKDGTQIAIQVKHFDAGNKVGREPLQKLVSTLAKGDADQAVVVTSSDFAETAKRYATDFGTDLRLMEQNELLRRLSESTIPP